MATLEELVVLIKADIAAYEKNLEKADDATKGFADKTKKAVSSILP